MDLEETKKMNVMIKELTQKGCVQNFDEAVGMASNLYSKGMPEQKAVAQDTVEQPPVSRTNVDMSQIVDRRIQSHLSDIASQLNKELKNIWDAVDSMKAALKEVKEKNVAVSNAIVKEEAKPVREKEEVKVEVKEAKTESKDSKSGHPRNGSYKSDDVSIEKFFYCGQR